MIRLVEALNYRCLRYVRQPLGPFHVLVGPNASGKTTFLDILGFLNKLVADGLEAAANERSANVFDLIWGHQGSRFELAIEAVVPEGHYPPIDLSLSGEGYGIRYEVAIGLDARTSNLSILDEQVWLTYDYENAKSPGANAIPETVFKARSQDPRWRPLMRRSPRGAEYDLTPEVPDKEDTKHSDSYWIVYRPTGLKPVFQAMPGGEFPTAIWLESLLKGQVSTVDLETSALRRPARPGQGEVFVPNGDNLPWLIDGLRTRDPEQYDDWIAHLRTGLPDLVGVRIVDRPEDRHRYILVKYQNGLEVPSWMVSDGTLRLIALTFLAYRSDAGTAYLVEEPETHIHPLNIEVAMQSLSSVYGGQVLIATHSPAILAMTDASKVLVFSRGDILGTRIVPGHEHPRLRDWKGEVSLGTLFAGGVLG